MKKIFFSGLLICSIPLHGYVPDELEEAIKETNIKTVKRELARAQLTGPEREGLLDLAKEKIKDYKKSLDDINQPRVAYTHFGHNNTYYSHPQTLYTKRDDVIYEKPYSSLAVWGTMGTGIACMCVAPLFLAGLGRNNEMHDAAIGGTILGSFGVSIVLICIGAYFEYKNEQAYKAALKKKYDEAIAIKQLLYRYEV